MEIDKYYCVYSRRVANELKKRDFKIERIGINYAAPKYECYFFKNNKKFRETLEEILDFFKKS